MVHYDVVCCILDVFLDVVPVPRKEWCPVTEPEESEGKPSGLLRTAKFPDIIWPLDSDEDRLAAVCEASLEITTTKRRLSGPQQLLGFAVANQVDQTHGRERESEYGGSDLVEELSHRDEKPL